IIKVDCDYCGKGFEGPRGYVTENYDYVSKVHQITIDQKEVNEGQDGKKCRYRYGHYLLDSDDISDTKDAAETRLLEKIEKYKLEEEQRIAWHKENSNKSYAWHVGYHRRCAAKAKRDLDYHEAKAVAMGKHVK
ncbi:MAG: hypothetical protein Q8L22_27280, partial [Reyranella sp.]|nr:hypothetical protein [Reyranella sp.]